MAFPVVANIANSTQFTPSTTHDVTIPAGGGQLVLVEFCHGNNALEGHPEGFQLIQYVPFSVGDGNVNIAVRGFTPKPPLLPFLGVERGDRTAAPTGTLTLTTDSARRSDVYAIVFEEFIPVTFFLADRTTGGATPIDPPNLTYSASAKDVLWWAFGTGIGWAVNGYPTDFGLHQFSHPPADWGHSQGSGICARELNATSVNPGTWPAASGPTSDWHAITMGVAVDGP